VRTPAAHHRKLSSNAKESDSDFRFQQLVGYRIRSITSQLGRAAETLLIEHANITLFEWRILAALFEARGTDETATTLGPKVMLDKMQTGRNVSRLVKRGLVKSAPNHDDRRETLLQLTPAGTRAYHVAQDVIPMMEQWLLSAIPVSERERFHQMLDRLVTHTASLPTMLDQLREQLPPRGRRAKTAKPTPVPRRRR
jgi:DNA-binding MarR family transcriptional regulator